MGFWNTGSCKYKSCCVGIAIYSTPLYSGAVCTERIEDASGIQACGTSHFFGSDFSTFPNSIVRSRLCRIPIMKLLGIGLRGIAFLLGCNFYFPENYIPDPCVRDPSKDDSGIYVCGIYTFCWAWLVIFQSSTCHTVTPRVVRPYDVWRSGLWLRAALFAWPRPVLYSRCGTTPTRALMIAMSTWPFRLRRVSCRDARHVNTRDIHTRWRSQVVVAVARVDFDSEQLISLSKASGATKCL